ncbi:MAG TPA: OmpA family protein [Chitinophaga sp.]|uniref:OmpA family protein n=1 Tax=Chitinophaga sp. TaxID=1869181 RepID=UPI002CECE80A|nr:OmpA family protein [Chitinophaga sp.]HVI44375.1 OmpA family protein [Chitinophaga sp.]
MHAQSAGKLQRRADHAYAGLRFTEALHYYKLADEKQPANSHTIKHIALLEQALQHYAASLPWFEKINFDKEAPSWLLLYSQALASNGQYERADSCLRLYRVKTQTPVNYNFSETDKLFRDSAQWRIEYASLNSSLDEFSPAMYGRRLVYVTNQRLPVAVKRVYARNERPFLQLRMVADTGTIKYTDVRKIDSASTNDFVFRYIINDDDTYPTSNDSRVTGIYNFRYQQWKGMKRPGWNNGIDIFDRNVETKYHEGPVTFSSRFDTLYFTRNNYTPGKYRTGKDGVNRLKIFSAVFRNGVWQGITSFPYNNDDYATGHPALTPDGSTLFFVSDMPGGYGGKDIYYVVKAADGSWGKPVNAGPVVNTAFDEMFPYVDNKYTLYFSSNGRNGLGGLDIYRIQWENGAAIGAAQNMGYPVNTSKDDFGIWCTEDADGFHGYFSSDRYGDDDVFRFHMRPLRLRVEGSVFKRLTGLRQEGVSISLISTDQRRDTISDITGNFGWQLFPETDYELHAEKNGMKKVIVPFSTKGINTDSIIRRNIYLDTLDEGSTHWRKNCDSLRKLYTFPDVLFALDSYTVTDASKHSLERLATALKGDTSLSLIISSYTDARASVVYNNRLSARRSDAVAAWLVQAGIAPGRLIKEYYGETRLKNGCKDRVPCPEYLHQQNRRTEFYIIKDGINITLECNEQSGRK